MTIDTVLAELLRPVLPRDGVTISGGEPFGQAEACARLVARLKAGGIHVAVYTGHTYEQLARSTDSAVLGVLNMADLLVDGAYVAALRKRDLAYRGSCNQRIIDLWTARRFSEVRVLEVD